MLRISTIASAIADVSLSTDPSQLAAMMKALRNRATAREWEQEQECGKHSDCSALSPGSPGDAHRSDSSSAFDVEKYLAKTEVSRCEGGLERESLCGLSDVWNLSSLREQLVQGVHVFRGPRDRAVAAFPEGSEESESQALVRTTDTSDLALTPMSQKETARVAANWRALPFVHALPGVGHPKEAASSSLPVPSSSSSDRSPRRTPLCLLEGHEEIHNWRQTEAVSETDNSDKHLAFDDPCVVSSGSVGEYRVLVHIH